MTCSRVTVLAAAGAGVTGYAAEVAAISPALRARIYSAVTSARVSCVPLAAGAAQGGAVGQRLLHQAVQLRVPQRLPPFGARPVYGGAGRLIRLAAIERVRVRQRRLWRDMAHVGASAKGKGQAGGQQTAGQEHVRNSREIFGKQCKARRGERREWPGMLRRNGVVLKTGWPVFI